MEEMNKKEPFMFSKTNQTKLKKNGFEMISEDENIWIKEKEESSVTISGEDNNISAMWQNYTGDFEEVDELLIDSVLEWTNEILFDE